MDIAKARAEIERSVKILRSRYHYAHPIFDHLGDALTALEGQPEVAPQPEPVETVAELKAEAEEAVAIGEEDANAEPEPPAQRARKRG